MSVVKRTVIETTEEELQDMIVQINYKLNEKNDGSDLLTMTEVLGDKPLLNFIIESFLFTTLDDPFENWTVDDWSDYREVNR
jgi:hypothetical protein